MLKTYSKGARGERELLHFLNHKGFAVSRAPSSGGFLTAIDIVAIKKGLILGIECKAHQKKPRINKLQLQRFREWINKAGAIGLIAWRTPEPRWKFLRLEDAENNRYEDENWIERDVLLNALGIN